jgi:type II secretory pathway predicted ATPase ExeA
MMATKAQAAPFSLTPDPSLLYQTAALKTVLFKARYVVEQRQGLTCILGDVGLGKSTVLRHLHGQIAASDEFSTAFIPSPNYPSDFALLKAICGDFGLPPRRSMLAQENELRLHLVALHEQGKTAVVFLDEAQRLPGKQMELIRVLMNFETNKAKLIQIVMAAQLELENKLRDPSKRAIKSRIFLPSILSPLSLPEARDMLAFRCEQSFVPNPFDDDAVKAIYDASEGVPRDILKIANAAYVLMKGSGLSSVPAESIPSVVLEAKLRD